MLPLNPDWESHTGHSAVRPVESPEDYPSETAGLDPSWSGPASAVIIYGVQVILCTRVGQCPVSGRSTLDGLGRHGPCCPQEQDNGQEQHAGRRRPG